jgi:hypothetical protein
VLSRLDSVRTSGGGFMARCPAHNDRIPSLSVGLSRRGGGVLIHCFAGCCTEDVLAALGLTYSDLYDGWGLPAQNVAKPAPSIAAPAASIQPERKPRLGRPSAIYTYLDEEEQIVMQVRRWDTEEGKMIRQRRPDGSGGWINNLRGVRRVLYRLPELVDAIGSIRRIYVVEGEKNVEDLRSRGLVATTNPHGAGTWNSYGDGYGRSLAGAHVVLLADNDDPGRAHRAEVAHAVAPFVASLRLVDLPGLAAAGADVSDWLAGGGSAGELERLADCAIPVPR